MSVVWPEGYRIESIRKSHPRSRFTSGQAAVDDWLRTKALQQSEKRLSSTKVLSAPDGSIAGFYTLAMGEIEFGKLPEHFVKGLPRRNLPLAFLAWLGIDSPQQRKGLGERLLVQALTDALAASEHLSFVALALDCLDEGVKGFYLRFDFEELPEDPLRLFLSHAKLRKLILGSAA